MLLEDKGLTLALHYRKAPEVADAAAAAAEAAAAESRGALVLLHGKMVCELKPPGVDKGRAIAAFLEEPPFAGRQPVFAGDDVTDEAGFVDHQPAGRGLDPDRRPADGSRVRAARTFRRCTRGCSSCWRQSCLNIDLGDRVIA